MPDYGMIRQDECEKQLAERQPTIRERLTRQKGILEKQLTNINNALEALDKNPEFETVHNLLSKAGF